MRVTFFFFMVVLFHGSVATAHADKPAPASTYKKLSANGKFVFVMLAPERWAEEDLRQKAAREIRSTYVRSGLYRNDGSTDPLWTVDWYAFSVVVVSDGIHLVRFGEWPFIEHQGLFGWLTSPRSDDLKQEAVSFFANGRMIRQYSIGELVDWPILLPKSVSHFQWLSESRLIDERNQFEITTKDQNHLVFNLTDGTIVAKRAVATWIFGASATALGSIIALVVWKIFRRRRARKEPGDAPQASSEPTSEASAARQQTTFTK